MSVFHRGQTDGPLPSSVEHLYGDRSDPDRLASAIGSRSFDVVVDTTLYTGEDARAAARIFESRVSRYIMVSTGQVYLVRPELSRPYREEDYAGPTIPMPEDAIEDWRYGIDKRAAEDALILASQLSGASSRRRSDPHSRGPHLELRHVYGADVVRGIPTRRFLSTCRSW